MHRFYVEPSSIQNDTIMIEGTDVNHIKNVLRINIGEEIVVCDGVGKDYYCEVMSISKEEVVASIKEEKMAGTELGVKVYLFQGLPKKDKMELIVQKAVELGVYEIIPVKMKRTIVKIDNEKKEQARNARWQTIANEASKQSRRGILPQVHKIVNYKEALVMAKEMDLVMLPYELAKDMEYTRKVMETAKEAKSIGIFIGPEGGFEDSEIEMAKEIDFKPITLGQRILRTETAGLATLAMLVYNLE